MTDHTYSHADMLADVVLLMPDLPEPDKHWHDPEEAEWYLCDANGMAYPADMTFDCGCGDEQETCQTQHYIVGEIDGVIAWNPEFDEPPSPFDMELAALAPTLAAEVIRLREEITAYAESVRETADDHDEGMEWEAADALFRVAYDLTRIIEGDVDAKN